MCSRSAGANVRRSARAGHQRDRDVVEQRGPDRQRLVRRRLVRGHLHERVDDDVAEHAAREHGEQADADDAPAGRAQRHTAPPLGQVDREDEQQEGDQRQHDREAFDRFHDVLRGLQLRGAQDHDATARRGQFYPELFLHGAARGFAGRALQFRLHGFELLLQAELCGELHKQWMQLQGDNAVVRRERLAAAFEDVQELDLRGSVGQAPGALHL
jgi:hypothetical protein